MPKLNVLNQTGKTVAELTLSDYVFGIEPHQQVLYDVVNAQRAAMRQGTHDVKNRGEVSGGGRKPWRQKGTGRARQGSTRSPQWRHGGVVFGPTPRSYAIKLNQKVRQLALRSALSYHAANGQLKVVDSLAIEAPKTKLFQQLLSDLGISGKTLVIASEFSDNELLAARNIPTVAFSLVNHVSVYDILNCKNLVITKDAVTALEEVLGND
ncbi:MAG: 50S ribosomal protein L4 [Tenericutes bacterium GWC2_34_14]|nr:MAG: 50S ribosomal protein L4 [Tenericutes bacterium GWC2_34_14]OHE34016.1 MAG: 50S ribosomal protein L4 [Tenericutes bacterium GWE2_34_108]OHE35349.1 MAG: 50S ribosomal protein L4 [Tenericutes bacterium GWF1_35_14]OHE38382.1 MAG: 50S ribosomal protein L4 [Tenericutes bacterium GWF2_35_184]OHE42717.1 MAG: 50S ribosomal protein L4 [Tenericutes bacterium RIFOXYA2_FULL_36_32]OHE43243.1 MAG: 50S ribosomal protein L4 [Tenericutes bacterium RIFOXYA12_FULL_35_10]OHE47139.1 MAG: 50S ribosomal prot